MNKDIRAAMLGDHEAAKRLTDAGVLIPFPSMVVVFRPKMEMLEGVE